MILALSSYGLISDRLLIDFNAPKTRKETEKRVLFCHEWAALYFEAFKHMHRGTVCLSTWASLAASCIFSLLMLAECVHQIQLVLSFRFSDDSVVFPERKSVSMELVGLVRCEWL
jgi:hypothetical protein